MTFNLSFIMNSQVWCARDSGNALVSRGCLSLLRAFATRCELPDIVCVQVETVHASEALACVGPSYDIW